MLKIKYLSTIFTIFIFLIHSCGYHVFLDLSETGGQDPMNCPPSINNEYLYYSDYDVETSSWIMHLSRIQCETIYYCNLESAVEYLNDNNIIVLHAKEIVNFHTCDCGSNSGIYFSARIDNKYLNQAHSLGWRTMSSSE